ncbi:hypothetical protein WN943_001763 [Citrus x changshan-huyou]
MPPRRRNFFYGLPDDILRHIIACLPTKNAVGTSLISRQWIDLWTEVEFHQLALDDSDLLEPDLSPDTIAWSFQEFVSDILDRVNLLVIRRFYLHCLQSYDAEVLRDWVVRGWTNNVVEVDIRVDNINEDNFLDLPSNLCTSTALKVLKLQGNITLDPDPDQRVIFPSLRILHMDVIQLGVSGHHRDLYRCCPVLDDLYVRGNIAEPLPFQFDVVSTSVRNLNSEFYLEDKHFDNEDNVSLTFEINTQNLVCLELRENFFAQYILRNLNLLEKADIGIGGVFMCPRGGGFDFDHWSDERISFLPEVYNVNSLALSGCTVGVSICFFFFIILSFKQNAGAASSDDDDDFTGGHVELLPTFYSLEKLKLGFVYCCSWNFLPFALERSPFLQSLDLEKEAKGEFPDCVQRWEERDVPADCLRNCLRGISVRGFGGKLHELQVIEYLLKNARVLRRMDIYASAEGGAGAF